jgi:hypothetical protein
MRRALSLLAAASAAAMLLPSAAGAVTVGAPLGAPVNQVEGCEYVVLPSLRPFGVPPSCTFLGVDSAGAWSTQTPPGSWTITTARVRTGLRVGPMVFTVLRALRSQAGSPPAGIICCTTPVESQVFVPARNTVNEIPVNLPVVNTVEDIEGEPVEVVDYLGISLLDLNSSVPFSVAAGSTANASFIAPAIRAGQQRLVDGTLPAATVLVNGEYQPAPATTPVPETVAPVTPPLVTPLPAPFRLLPGLRLLPGGTRARLGVDAPGPGLLRAFAPALGQARAGQAPTAAASVRRKKGKRRKPRLLIPASRRIKRAGKAYITVKLTKAGKRRLRKRGKLRLPLRIVFKPVDGSPTRRSRNLTFRR